MKFTEKQVAILSRHAVPNYGSLLQAYALQQATESLGIKSYYIDAEYCYYSPKQIANVAMKTSKYKNYPLLSTLSYLRKFERYKDSIPLFREYQEKWLNLSETRYYTESSLYDNYPVADIYLIGSDQVWNVMPDGEICNTYFLENIHDKSKISYAASFGSRNNIKNSFPYMKDRLKEFDFITVREDDGVAILSEMGIDGAQVLDPTLLLSSNEWDKLCEKPKSIPNNYILLYQVNRNKKLCQLAEIIANKLNITLIRLSPDKSEKYWIKEFTYLPKPSEFIYYFKNADYIITDSFHGTCFSILYKKKFAEFLPEIHSERILSLLKLCGLEERIVTDSMCEDEIIELLRGYQDWSRTNESIKNEKERCIMLLKDMLFGG